MDAERGDVEGLLTLALQDVVVELWAGLDDYFRDRVREIDALTQADVVLDHGRGAAWLGDDQIARMRSRLRRGHRDVEQMDRRLELGFGSDVDEGAVLDKCGVERIKRIIIHAC